MGLAIEVGYLRDMKENDEEGYDWFINEMEKINSYLKEQDIPEHIESEEAEIWSIDMYGYSGLHYLRRLAAHIDKSDSLPIPGDENAANDEVLEKYCDNYLKPKKPSIFSFFKNKKVEIGNFDHLIIHSDAEGYYLPIDFEKVLIPPDSLGIPGGIIGSSVRLLKECEKLAQFLNIPEDIHPEDDNLWDAVESQGESEIIWKKYGIESYTCLGLLYACRHSIKTRSAIVFC